MRMSYLKESGRRCRSEVIMSEREQPNTGNTIVSANYRHYDPHARWLLRSAGDTPEKARTAKAVVARGVTFRQSSVEAGFGCSVVADCEDAVSFESVDSQLGPETKEPGSRWVKLHFIDSFFYLESGSLRRNYITACDRLVLYPDGRVVARIAA